MHEQQPVVFITGEPSWVTSAADALREAGFQVQWYPALDGAQGVAYLNTLIDAVAALILVDGTRADWQSWLKASKNSQATRRIPALVVADDPEVERAAPLAGASDVLAPDEITGLLAAKARQVARIIDPDVAGEMECQCGERLPPLAVEAVAMFNAGEYYLQHDLFEEQWMAEAGPVRELYRAVLQVGVAYYHITRGNYRGAVKMLRRSVQWFAMLPDVCQGVNVKQLREDAGRVRLTLEDMKPSEIASFDRTLLKPVLMVDSD